MINFLTIRIILGLSGGFAPEVDEEWKKLTQRAILFNKQVKSSRLIGKDKP